jgi:hypothetical protein
VGAIDGVELLPPGAAPQSAAKGVFYAESLDSLTIDICDRSASGCLLSIQPLERFTRASAPSKRIERDGTAEQFHVNWRTGETDLVARGLYRLRIAIAGLPAAALDFDMKGDTLTDASTGKPFGRHGQVIPLKVRVNRSATLVAKLMRIHDKSAVEIASQLQSEFATPAATVYDLLVRERFSRATIGAALRDTVALDAAALAAIMKAAAEPLAEIASTLQSTFVLSDAALRAVLLSLGYSAAEVDAVLISSP